MTNAYDAVRYSTHSQPETHPDRLAVVARLLGLHAAPVTNCRVLEVGCGDGNNLIPIAWSLPNSEFIGVDLAAAPIISGTEMITSLGISNAKLVNADLAAIDESWGNFDYVIAHGFYSWVPPATRDQLFAMCRRCLKPNGVAFVSYNVYPGCHMRDMMRELMLFHVRDEVDPARRIQQARSLLSLLATAHSGRKDGDPILAEVNRTLEHTDAHLYHDDLAEINDPVYFTDFASHAASHGLAYLGEADFFESSAHSLPTPVREALDGLRGNRLMYEQYLDIVKFRRFRQTLLCHSEVAVSGEIDPAALRHFRISSSATESSSSGGAGEGTRVFATGTGARAETDHQTGLAALEELQLLWPRSASLDELASGTRNRLVRRAQLSSEAEVRDSLIEFLVSVYSAGIVNFHTHLVPAAASVPLRPTASIVSRWQAAHGRSVTTLHHNSLRVADDLERSVLGWLDGTRDLATLRNQVHEHLRSRGLLADGVPDEQSLAKVEVALAQNLEKLARLGLLLDT
jgi:methyltransferase-like protein/trans-aconitate methyltransferase